MSIFADFIIKKICINLSNSVKWKKYFELATFENSPPIASGPAEFGWARGAITPPPPKFW